jgi:hypothetical protein
VVRDSDFFECVFKELGEETLAHGTDNDQDFVYANGNADPLEAAMVMSYTLVGYWHFDEPSPEWAIIRQANRRAVIKDGTVVARDGEITVS